MQLHSTLSSSAPRPKTARRLPLWLGGLLSLALALPAGSQQTAPEIEQIVESKTKISFPVQRTAERAAEGEVERLDLCGIGLRTKTMFKVKVYAFGLYVDPWGAQETLGEDYAGQTVDQLRGSRRFYEQLCEDNFTKSLALTFAREVGGDDVADAFSGSIKPRLRTATRTLEMADATAELTTFKGFFDVKKLKKGATIELTWHPGYRLTTLVNGEEKAEIISPALCWAIFDTYFGTDPIQSKAKQRLISIFPGVLSQELPDPPLAPAREAQPDAR